MRGMNALLSTIEDVFDLAGRGCVVVPGIPSDAPVRFKVGDALLLVRPDGTKLKTLVRGIEMIGAPRPHSTPLLLPANKEQVPVRTVIYLAGVASA